MDSSNAKILQLVRQNIELTLYLIDLYGIYSVKIRLKNNDANQSCSDGEINIQWLGNNCSCDRTAQWCRAFNSSVSGVTLDWYSPCNSTSIKYKILSTPYQELETLRWKEISTKTQCELLQKLIAMNENLSQGILYAYLVNPTNHKHYLMNNLLLLFHLCNCIWLKDYHDKEKGPSQKYENIFMSDSDAYAEGLHPGCLYFGF